MKQFRADSTSLKVRKLMLNKKRSRYFANYLPWPLVPYSYSCFSLILPTRLTEVLLRILTVNLTYSHLSLTKISDSFTSNTRPKSNTILLKLLVIFTQVLPFLTLVLPILINSYWTPANALSSASGWGLPPPDTRTV